VIVWRLNVKFWVGYALLAHAARPYGLGLFTFIRLPHILKPIAISHFWFKRFICDDLATTCWHLV